MIRRRRLLIALGASALTAPRIAPAQQPAPPRIVFLSPINAAQSATRIGAFPSKTACATTA